MRSKAEKLGSTDSMLVHKWLVEVATQSNSGLQHRIGPCSPLSHAALGSATFNLSPEKVQLFCQLPWAADLPCSPPHPPSSSSSNCLLAAVADGQNYTPCSLRINPKKTSYVFCCLLSWFAIYDTNSVCNANP